MINWEQPPEQPACPHCGSTETHLTLQLLGLTRYSCQTCRKSFAAEGEAEATSATRPEITPTSPQA